MIQFTSQYVNVSSSPSLFGDAIVLVNTSAKLVNGRSFDTIQLHLRMCGTNMYVRRFYLDVLKPEILLNPLHWCSCVVRNTQHVVNVANDLFIIPEAVWIHFYP